MEFRRTGRTSVYEGKILRVFRDDVEVRPGDGRAGRTLHLEHVEHPGAACVVPFLDDERILLLRQFRYSAGGELWEIPAGKLDGLEPPEACAERELVEEAGYHPGKLERLGTLIMTPGFSDERCTIFAATALQPRQPNAADDEFFSVVEMPFVRALEMVEEGEIKDAKTVAGLLLAARRRGL
jgi:ADP-ribose pyrophosphatase